MAEQPSTGIGGTVLVVEDDTDLAMPELGGRQLAQRLVEECPDLPVVFMSGYTDNDLARRGLLDAGVPFLEKPLSPEILTRKMREVLEGAARKS